MIAPLDTALPVPRDWLTLFEASIEYGISPWTLRRRIREGALPWQKLPFGNGLYLVRREDVAALAAARVVP
jgi:hypothetical protein